VKWLEEILYLYDARGFVPCGIEMKRFTGTQLTAALSGEQISTTKHATRIDVKAITYHQLEIKENEGGVRVRVFVDI
jgi:SHS2 domain-containing protein